jgi:hypothetical protein
VEDKVGPDRPVVVLDIEHENVHEKLGLSY